MTQILIDVGSQGVGPIRGALLTALADVHYGIDVLSTDSTATLEYQATSEEFDLVCSRLEAGVLSSARLRPTEGDVAWALMFGPTFGNERPRPWTGAVELRHRKYRPLFDALVKRDDLDFVVASQEETLDLAPEHLTPSGFPWHDWQLLRAAIPQRPSAPREWVIRAGPADPVAR